jgi:hypothetical protein
MNRSLSYCWSGTAPQASGWAKSIAAVRRRRRVAHTKTRMADNMSKSGGFVYKFFAESENFSDSDR